MDDLGSWGALLTALAMLVAVTVALAWLAAKLLVFALVTLPARVRQPQQAKAVLSLVIALIPLGDITKYLTRVSQSAIAVLQTTLSQFGYALSNCDYGCQSELTSAVRSASDELMKAAYTLVAEFPILSVLIYVILAAAIYAILNAVRLRGADGTIAPNFDAPGVSSLTFIGAVLFSMYLSLSALLAVPLMQRQAPPDGYSQTEFEARLANAMPSQAQFLQTFQEVSLAGGADAPPAALQGAAARLPIWNAARDDAYQALLSKKNVAIETFRSQSALGLGGRDVVSHDAALYMWFTDQRDAVYRQMRTCLASVRDAVGVANLLAAKGSATAVDQELLAARSAFDTGNTDRLCNAVDFGTDADVPGRANRVEGLTSFIRDWTRWLIGPESMPLIIIVGLVGFSFLGASLSRVIRLGVGRQLENLSLSDLILVILSGASAALLIFLASYGGLVVLGESDSDPSPYVVFAFCFVAAIFSEDVWAWARTNILGRVGSVKVDAPPTNPSAPSPDADKAPTPG